MDETDSGIPWSPTLSSLCAPPTNLPFPILPHERCEPEFWKSLYRCHSAHTGGHSTAGIIGIGSPMSSSMQQQLGRHGDACGRTVVSHAPADLPIMAGSHASTELPAGGRAVSYAASAGLTLQLATELSPVVPRVCSSESRAGPGTDAGCRTAAPRPLCASSQACVATESTTTPRGRSSSQRQMRTDVTPKSKGRSRAVAGGGSTLISRSASKASKPVLHSRSSCQPRSVSRMELLRETQSSAVALADWVASPSASRPSEPLPPHAYQSQAQFNQSYPSGAAVSLSHDLDAPTGGASWQWGHPGPSRAEDAGLYGAEAEAYECGVNPYELMLQEPSASDCSTMLFDTHPVLLPLMGTRAEADSVRNGSSDSERLLRDHLLQLLQGGGWGHASAVAVGAAVLVTRGSGGAGDKRPLGSLSGRLDAAVGVRDTFLRDC